MSKEHELPSDSDEDDEDYVPGGAGSEAGSEVDSEGEAESGPEEENDENCMIKKGKKQERKNTNRGTKRTRKVAKDLDKDQTSDSEETSAKKQLTEEEEKKRADSLWADFMKDTPSKPKSTNTSIKSSANSTAKVDSPVAKPAIVEKVKITKVFEFAGEEVRVEKEVLADSAEARLTLPSVKDSKLEPTACLGVRKGGLGGISSVLGQLGKKAKISTLEKSKLDWDSYKRQENIEEEITTHNKGKDGYLEKQDFLQRADQRQFELEKQMRSSRRSSR